VAVCFFYEVYLQRSWVYKLLTTSITLFWLNLVCLTKPPARSLASFLKATDTFTITLTNVIFPARAALQHKLKYQTSAMNRDTRAKLQSTREIRWVYCSLGIFKPKPASLRSSNLQNLTKKCSSSLHQPTDTVRFLSRKQKTPLTSSFQGNDQVSKLTTSFCTSL